MNSKNGSTTIRLSGTRPKCTWLCWIAKAPGWLNDNCGCGSTSGWREKPVGLSEGDYTLELSAHRGEQVVTLPTVAVSVVKDSDTRLKQLESWLATQAQSTERTDQSETIRHTVRQYVQLIRSQVDQRPLETDYPTARLLRMAEALMQAPEKLLNSCVKSRSRAVG